jgi:uncharacterized membrane protein YjjP (DUF1212 family)
MPASDTMDLQDRSDLVLDFAQVLHVNGQSTDETVAASKRLGNALGMSVSILPRWGELELQAAEGTTSAVSIRAADPTGVHMGRVTSAMRAIDEMASGKLEPIDAVRRIREISVAPPAPTWQFVIAAAGGAAALSVIFGVQHPIAVALIASSAAIGAVLRRILGRYSTNILLQPFIAALVAGLVGALAVLFDLSSSLRLVAVCPCMILVPGPHVLNGAMDLLSGRVHLGASRLIYAGLIILAIATGLLLGLGILGVSLPVDPSGPPVPIELDVISAGIAVAAYSIFFSTPLRMLPWPVAIGSLAHALRWATLTFVGAGVAVGALVACLVVGLVMTPVAHRGQMPFAAIGFAAVVSLVPGVYLFRFASGLVQLADGSQTTLILLSQTISDGLTAAMIILAMSFGLIVPNFVIGHIRGGDRWTKP